MDKPQRNSHWKRILIPALLLLLFGSCTALGISWISRNREPHPMVTIPVETQPLQTEEPTTEPTTEPTAFTTEPPVETTVETAASPEPTAPKPTTSPQPTTSPKPTEPETQQATLLRLHKRQPGDNVAFYAVNMVPGDEVTQSYCVRVTHSQSLTLRFRATIRPGYEKLAEVLKVRVRLPAKNVTLYNGLLRDMPTELHHRLTTAKRVEQDVVYEITGYLDTSVGNAYQGRELVADFTWLVEEQENLSPPKTGDSSGILFWMVVASGTLIALMALIFLLYRRRRQLAQLLMVLTLLSLCLSGLCVTGYAAGGLKAVVERNRFQTGELILNLNDGKAVMDCSQDAMYARMEPGMTCAADFFVENAGTVPFYYKLYFDEIDGQLADVLTVSVTTADGSRTIYDARPMREFTRLEAGRAREYLKENGAREHLKLWIYFPAEAGNMVQEKNLTFRLRADAVQAEHNPNGEFE